MQKGEKYLVRGAAECPYIRSESNVNTLAHGYFKELRCFPAQRASTYSGRRASSSRIQVFDDLGEAEISKHSFMLGADKYIVLYMMFTRTKVATMKNYNLPL